MRDKKGAMLFKPFSILLFLFSIAIMAPVIYGQDTTIVQDTTTVSGKVTSAKDNSPLAGANVVLKGQKRNGNVIGTQTDAKGVYHLKVPSLNGTLVFSFIGFQKKQVQINGRRTVNVQLKIKVVKSKKQVVVVGYGSQARQDLTGAISGVSSKDLQAASVTTPDEALQGHIAGVSVHKNSHAPGGSISVHVRGTASLNAGGSPLYVIDGIPINNNNVQTGTGNIGAMGAPPNPLNSIDPSDIASIQVLKDASAAAIYGSRGANGVVLITTKEGQAGQQQINFNSSVGMSEISHELNFMDAKQYAIQRNEGKVLRGKPPLYTQQQINNFGVGTNWQNAVFRKAIQQKYKLSFSGGSDSLRYYISGDYDNNQGIIRHSGLKRYGARANINADINKYFSVSTNLSYTMTDDHRVVTGSKGYGAGPGLISAVMQAAPTIPARDSLGNPTILRNFPAGDQSLGSPLVITDRYKNRANTNRFLGNVLGQVNILDNLTLKVRLGADIRDWRFHRYYPIGSRASGGNNGKALQITDRTVNVVDNNTLTYRNDFNGVNSLKILAGFTYQTQKFERLMASSYGFPSDFYSFNNLGIGTNPQSPGSNANRFTLISYLGRINYSLYDKYLLTATFRIDGDSKFGRNKKYGTFPSAAIAWRMGKEKFIQNLGVFSHLKLRVGYGQTGNESIGVYQSQALIASEFSNGTGYVYNGVLQPVAFPNGIANPNLSWEKTEGWNFGLNMGFLNERLSLSANYYRKKTVDLLLNVPLPRQTGFSSVLKNTGSMSNNGIGIQIKTQNIRSKLVNWSTSLNFAANRNKILSLSNQTPFVYTGFVGGGNIGFHGGDVIRLQPGHPVGSFYGAVYDGIWHSQKEIDQVGTMPAAQPGDIRYKDVNGDGTFDTNDDVFLGSANPKFTYGMTNDLSVKNWNLHVFIYGDYGNKVLNLPAARLVYASYGLSAKRLKRWTADSPNNPYPSANSARMKRVSSAIVQNGSFLRIQNVTLSYNFPLAKWHMKSIRKLKIGFSVDNLAVFTPYDGYDPEVNSYGNSNTVKGIDRYAYPASRTFRFNINIGF
jgi:TonB-linked SusC/RagA family outer membrane protein